MLHPLSAGGHTWPQSSRLEWPCQAQSADTAGPFRPGLRLHTCVVAVVGSSAPLPCATAAAVLRGSSQLPAAGLLGDCEAPAYVPLAALLVLAVCTMSTTCQATAKQGAGRWRLARQQPAHVRHRANQQCKPRGQSACACLQHSSQPQVLRRQWCCTAAALLPHRSWLRLKYGPPHCPPPLQGQVDEQLPQVFFDAVQALMMVLGAFVLVRVTCVDRGPPPAGGGHMCLSGVLWDRGVTPAAALPARHLGPGMRCAQRPACPCPARCPRFAGGFAPLFPACVAPPINRNLTWLPAAPFARRINHLPVQLPTRIPPTRTPGPSTAPSPPPSPTAPNPKTLPQPNLLQLMIVVPLNIPAPHPTPPSTRPTHTPHLPPQPAAARDRGALHHPKLYTLKDPIPTYQPASNPPHRCCSS